MPQRGSAPAPARLSIALVHYAAPPVVGGVERVVARQAALMADAGHDVRIVAGRGGSQDPRIRFVQVPLIDPRNPTIAGLQLALDEGQIPPAYGRVVVALTAALETALRGVDVVIAHNVCSLNLNLALTTALRDLRDRPDSPRLVLWHHDLAWTSPRDRPTLHSGAPWDLLRTAWPGTVQVVVSEARRAALAALTGIRPESIAVVPNGVDVARLLKLDPRTVELMAGSNLFNAEPLLLMASRITPRKNVELALRVIAAMRAAGRPAGLIVTGPSDPHRPAGGAYPDQLVALRHELVLDEHAWFISADRGVSPPDGVVRDLYRLADVLFMPSFDEGFGLPILEAGINRLPIVCTGLPVFRELVGDAAFYIEAGDDPARVATEVLRLVDADRIGRLARDVRVKYAWEAVFRERIAPLLAAD
jgi:mannosylglucosylglycerate synthase